REKEKTAPFCTVPEKKVNTVGLETVVYSVEGIKYLFAGDFDNGHYDVQTAKTFVKFLEKWISFVQYTTLNGFHIIGLTPLDALQWGMLFHAYQNAISKMYDGRIIRLSLKKDEKQKLMHASFKRPVVKQVYEL